MGLKISGADKMIDGFISGTVYVGLKVGNTEVSGNGYSRKAVAANGWTLTNQSSNTIRRAANKSKISWTAGGSWGTVTKFALYDNSSGGNELADFDLDTSRAVTQTGTVVEVAIGAIKIEQPLT